MNWIPLCNSIVVDQRLSQCFRTRVVGILVPSIPMLLLVFITLTKELQKRSWLVRSAVTKLNAPFSQFLKMDELPEYNPALRNTTSNWKPNTLRFLSFVQSFAWGFLGLWIVSQDRSGDILYPTLSAALWLLCALYLHPLHNAPKLVIIFMALSTMSAAVDFADSSTTEHSNLYVPVVVSVRVLTDLYLTWLAGSLPLNYEPSCSYVASKRDTPSKKLCSPEDGVSLWEWVTFSFVEPILNLAVERAKVTTTKESPKTAPSDRLVSGAITPASTAVESNDHDPLVILDSASTISNSRLVIEDGDDNELDVLENQFGPRRTLSEEDIWSLPPSFLHRNVFQKHLSERSLRPSESLTRYLLRSNSLDLIIDLSVELWKATVGFVPPYALQELLKLLSNNTPSDARLQAYLYVFLTFVAHLSFAQLDLFRGWHSRRCYERTRGQMFCALHWKTLKRKDITGLCIDGENKDMADLGKVLNLMQGDTYAVAQRFWEFSGVLAAPVRLIIALVFLYNVLGWSSIAGVIVVIVAWILNYPLAKRNIHITREFWQSKDTRMKGVNELFQNIRLLKYFGWDNRWTKGVNRTREVELSWRIKQAIIDTLISFLWSWVPSATALFAFMSYTLIEKKDLTVSKAFVSLALFDQLQAPLTALPGQVIALLNAYVSMRRIETYLAEEEVSPWATCLNTGTPESTNHTSKSGQIGFENATFQWDSIKPVNEPIHSRSQFMLRDLDIFFPIGQLSIIAGPTGSGKTALLNALLGELHCVSGKVHINKADHRVAYAGQTPWLEHATIRDNILYGCQFDHNRYETVLDACSLENDLTILPGGDLTEVGEKGVTLSGGQRARIALARAVYTKAECLLLDDPLAAVDMHTANHIYEKCITGKLLRGKTVILVTHHISLCITKAKYLVELADGRVVRQGMVEDLRKAGKLKEIQTEQYIIGIEEVEVLEEKSVTNTHMDQISSSLAHSRTRANGIKGKLVEAETRVEGRIRFSTYRTYLRAGGWFLWILSLTLLLSLRGVVILNQMFLAKWGNAYDESNTGTHLPIVGTLPPPHIDVSPWLIIFLILSGISAFSTLFYIGSGYYTSVRASRHLFTQMLFRLSRAPIQFFDVTPLGRIMNRFVTDFGTVDGQLNDSARKTLDGVLTFTSSFIVIIALVPSFLPFAVIIAYLYIRLAPSFILASRDLRRLELTSLSPTFASFDELLHGLPHVRAFAMENQYQNRFYRKVDRFQSYDHVYWLLSMWMRWRYDCLGSVVVFCASVFSLLGGVHSGYAAVIIVQAGIFAESSRQLIRVSAQLELDFNSVERISEYLIAPEEPPSIVQGSRPPAYWPSNSGGIQVEGLTVKYRPDLPPVLNALSFEVNPREKVGIVGRTGSGKSTLALSFLRMVEPASGRIVIDGIDISSIGLEDLRTRVTIISQDVSLFSGTIRSNLDPFDEREDHECWDILRRCHLVSDPGVQNSRLPANVRTTRIKSLDMPINQVGSLSAGERQLLALARAILRRSRVVIMDEATSAIDFELDSMVQKTIREELHDTLIITIAHRLHTIIDYDRVLVLDRGMIAEFDSPKILLNNPDGAFMQMCRKSVDWEDLRKRILLLGM